MWGGSVISEVTSPEFYSVWTIVFFEEFFDFVGNCAEKIGFVASKCVCEEDVLPEDFFRYEESIDLGLWSHKKLEVRGVSVTRFEDISHCLLQHRVVHVVDVVLFLVESKLKVSC